MSGWIHFLGTHDWAGALVFYGVLALVGVVMTFCEPEDGWRNWLISMAVLLIIAGIAYVVFHFIAKYW